MMELMELIGRELLKSECRIAESSNHSEVRQQPAFCTIDGKQQCNRCGATKNQSRISAPCFCGGCCFYCVNCLNMGKVRKCEYLYHVPERNSFKSIQDPILQWQGTLSLQQASASADIVKSVKDKETRLIWAVAGAGKTEMIFAGIEAAIKAGERVCIASPRVDVCLELAPRLQAVFPEVSTIVLYGASEETYRYTQMVIGTTHQLLRFKEAFDLVIIDEIDAFPFTVDNTLNFATEKARKKISCLIYLSATPSKEMQRQIKEQHLLATILPARYHGYPLPKPKCVWLTETMGSQKSKKYLLAQVKRLFQKKRRFLIFMPTIKEMLVFENELKHYFPDKRIASASAEDPLRKEHVIEMRQQEVDVLLTTTILERGVTFSDIDVLVYSAENRIFTTSALVQIAGRVGRHQQFPKGEVLFLHHGKSRSMKSAIKQIQQMNHLAQKRGLIHNEHDLHTVQ